MKHVELIIDYLIDGDDFQYFDNTGKLVRCRDCKHWDKYKAIDVGCCLRIDYDTATDDYCSRGERKESDEL